MKKKDNKIILALDNRIEDGLILIDMIRQNTELRQKLYGIKVGSIWVLEEGIDIVQEVNSRIWEDCEIIVDMQKWPTDIPEIVTKQVCRVAETGCVTELVSSPMGGGRSSLEAFVKSCNDGGIRPICELEMTHSGSDSYLRSGSYKDILYDAAFFGIDGFILPATKTPKLEIRWHLETAFPKLSVEFYTTGYRVGEDTEQMIRYGISRYIIGRYIYEAKDPIAAINTAYDDINGISQTSEMSGQYVSS